MRTVPPDTRDIGLCRECDLEVRFVWTEAGQPVPCNITPAREGRLAAIYNPVFACYIGGVWIGKAEECDENRVRFVPHSDTCGKKRPGGNAEIIAAIRAEILRNRPK